ncbi:MAG: pyridoxal-phosphate dependent enzyme [Mycoplasma sp.]|nr:pyridoxal-phosphate dependent enzyme [Mycoplasma sp.]
MKEKWTNPVKFSDIIDAEDQFLKSGIVYPCVLKYCNVLSERLKASIYHVVETFQRVKSFKIRGAYNAIASLTDAQKKKGVICASAGNHAQGTAISATKMGIKSYIVMPSNAPLSKVNATKNFGGNVILAPQPSFDAAYALSKKLAKEKGYVEIPPYDNVYTIAGQGTIALEALGQIRDLDTFIVPIGGGGLIAGIATAAKVMNPKIRIIGVQSAQFPAMKMSFDKKKIVSYATGIPTLADGCAVKTPGTITFDIIRHLVDEIVTVTEDEIIKGIATLSYDGKVIAEGAGAMPTAAILANKIKYRKGEKIALMVSGGNIDVIKYNNVLLNGLELLGRRVRVNINLKDNKKVALFTKILTQNSAAATCLLCDKFITDKTKPGKYDLSIISLSKDNMKKLLSDLTKNNFQFSRL